MKQVSQKEVPQARWNKPSGFCCPPFESWGGMSRESFGRYYTRCLTAHRGGKVPRPSGPQIPKVCD